MIEMDDVSLTSVSNHSVSTAEPEAHEQEQAPDNASIVQTPYMKMSVKAYHARPRYNIGATFFAWLTLAGYVVFTKHVHFTRGL
jgi:hypothetical protein